MAEFADIFIAKNSDEAINYQILEPNHPHIGINGLTDYEISALWASLEHSHIKAKHELIYIDTESDAVLYQLPEDFTIELANLPEDDFISVAIVWAEYEEIHWSREKAMDKIKEIKDLAQKAQQTQQQLYFILI